MPNKGVPVNLDRAGRKEHIQYHESIEVNAKQALEMIDESKESAEYASEQGDRAKEFSDNIELVMKEGPVQTVNGKTGNVSGLAEQVDLDDGLNSVNQQLAQNTNDLKGRSVNLSNFGFLGGADDRPIIQAAIDHLESEGGGTIYYPHTTSGYGVNSTHPVFQNAGIVIKENNIKFESINHTQIYAETEMDYLIYFPEVGFKMHSFSMEGIRLEGNQLCQIGIFSEGYIYRTAFIDTYVHNFIDKGMEAHVFTALFERCIFRRNKNVGIELNALDMPGTSATFINTNCSENETGYKLSYFNYSNLISTFGEYSNIVFDLERCHAVKFSGCGAEYIKQVIRTVRCSGVEMDSFYLGEIGYNGEPANEFLFDFKNSNSGHFGGVNRQETLQEGTKMVRFTDCPNMTMNYGRILKNRDQVVFVRSQVTVLDDIKRSTTDLIYYIDPNNGRDYADYENHGTSPNAAFKSWWKLVEVIPKNIDHRLSVTIMGDLDEVMDLKGIVVSDLLEISGNGFKFRSLDTVGCLGNINIDSCKFQENSRVYNSQGIRLTKSTYKTLEARYSTGLLIEGSVIDEMLWLRSGSTAQCRNNTGPGILRADSSIIFADGTEPTGEHRELYGGRIFRQ